MPSAAELAFIGVQVPRGIRGVRAHAIVSNAKRFLFATVGLFSAFWPHGFLPLSLYHLRLLFAVVPFESAEKFLTGPAIDSSRRMQCSRPVRECEFNPVHQLVGAELEGSVHIRGLQVRSLDGICG